MSTALLFLYCHAGAGRSGQPARSRHIIDEVKALVANGYREVVLTGVNIGYYADRSATPPVTSLAGLCRRILDQTDLYRLRLSSVEPQSVSGTLVQTYAALAPRICRHFHLPLQSGSDRILRMMRRPYSAARYLETVTALKEAVPGTIVGADVIVGFPGETPDDFSQTERVCRSGLIDYLHVFSYSDRPGTDAAQLPGKINPGVIKERNTLLRDVSKRLRFESHRRHVGVTLEVIAEHKRTSEGWYWGISDNYLRVKLPGTRPWGKEIVKFKPVEAFEDHLAGDVVTL